jgi:hypothetical protein
LGYEVVAMKEIYRDTARPAFPYCQKHNRLFAHYTVGWLTPAYPDKLHTFPAQCDICRAEHQRLYVHAQRIPA